MKTIKQQIDGIVYEIELLSSIGEIITVQVDLLGVDEDFTGKLTETFNDSRVTGKYINSMIIIEVSDSHNVNFHSLFDNIVEILGDISVIDGITALVRVPFGNKKIDVTLELTLSKFSPPQILGIADSSMYFDMVNLIQMKWQLALKRLLPNSQNSKLSVY